MWRDIALANRDALLQDLTACADQLQRVISMVEAGDPAAITDYFAQASKARVAWGNRKQ